jgi:hypothetical protein
LENRYVEKSPTNLEEHTALISRPGTVSLAQFAGGLIRGTYAKVGLFNGDLFVVSGPNFWRYSSNGTKTQITGIIYGTGWPYITWMKGIGYEYLFIADGLLLRYYNGGTHATGTLTLSGGSITNQVINIDGAYYSWNAAVDTNSPDGTSAHPWLAKLGGTDAISLANMVNLIQYYGIPGTDFSTALPGPNLDFTATSDATHLYITSTSPYAAGNAIATTVFSGGFLAWSGATLSGGNSHVLTEVLVPDGDEIKALASLAGYVLASVGNSQEFFWILPGATTIDPLNFAEKESNPDPINDMLTVGDMVMIMGSGSTEAWYASGQLDAPFIPIKGQAYARGVLEGSAVVVKHDQLDTVILVSDDSKVYSLGGGGFTRISDNGIEERIRTRLRLEQSLP